MNALEELREMIEEHWPHSNPYWRENGVGFALDIDAIADHIEEENRILQAERDAAAQTATDQTEARRKLQYIIEAEYTELPKDADGVPCKPGDHVRSGDTYGRITEILLFDRDGERWEVYLDTLDDSVSADSLLHVKPEPPDTQERIDADAGKGPCEYFGHEDMSCSDGGECRAASSHDGCYTYQRLDLLRRQRELDGRNDERTSVN